MRILFTSDIHDEEIVLEYIEKNEKAWDYLFIAGDISTNQNYLEDLAKTRKTYVIPGNNDPLNLREIFGDKYLHGKKIRIGNREFAFFGFSPPTPFGTIGEKTEEEIYIGLKRLNIGSDTILITHSPPYGVFDNVGRGIHAGSKAIRRIIEEKQPLANICGHIHEYEGIEKLGNTEIVKLPPAPTFVWAEYDLEKIKLKRIN